MVEVIKSMLKQSDGVTVRLGLGSWLGLRLIFVITHTV
jgi:hypothetical protein